MKIKKHFIIYIVIITLAISGMVYFFSLKQQNSWQVASSVCKIKELTFYYLKTCEWCNKAKAEGTLEKIEEFGIKINKIDAAVGPIRHKFQGVPTFVINGKVYEGYRTFEELKGLLGCPGENNGDIKNSAN